MKARLLLLMICILFACGKKDAGPEPYNHDAPAYLQNEYGKNVYICTGGSSKRYHCDRDCRGLNRCSGRIKAVPEEKAWELGRTPCRICH